MGQHDQYAASPQQPPAPEQTRPRHSRLGKLGLVIAIAFMAIGIAWPLLHKDAPTASPGGLVSTLSQQPGAIDSTVESAKRVWGSTLFKLGFSFAAAYVVAFALRAFFNFTLASLGFFIAALIGLQYAGVMEVKWHAGGEQFDTFIGWLGHQVSSLSQLVTGVLPSGLAGGLGVWSGWRR
ncbi:MAG: hypothetical protein ACREJO_10410 [Phycisphaerales bacterium]